nr:unnamed protein product [Haemonchus contortus]CDJ84903.1 unnamed protein product [Haemonchus contortus]
MKETIAQIEKIDPKELEEFEQVSRVQPARTRLRTRRGLRWKSSEEKNTTEEELASPTPPSSSPPYLTLTLAFIVLITLYYVYKKLKR